MKGRGHSSSTLVIVTQETAVCDAAVMDITEISTLTLSPSLTLPPSLTPSLSLSLTLTLFLSLSVCLSLSLSVPPSLSQSLSVSLCLCSELLKELPDLIMVTHASCLNMPT